MSDITDRLFLAWERGEDITVPWPTTLLLDARTHIETLEAKYGALKAQLQTTEKTVEGLQDANTRLAEYNDTLRKENAKLELELAWLREAAGVEVSRQRHLCGILRQELPPTTAELASLLQEQTP